MCFWLYLRVSKTVCFSSENMCFHIRSSNLAQCECSRGWGFHMGENRGLTCSWCNTFVMSFIWNIINFWIYFFIWNVFIELLRDEQHTDSAWFFIWNMWFEIRPCDLARGEWMKGVGRGLRFFPHGWDLWFFPHSQGLMKLVSWWLGKYYLYHNKLTYINLW